MLSTHEIGSRVRIVRESPRLPDRTGSIVHPHFAREVKGWNSTNWHHYVAIRLDGEFEVVIMPKVVIGPLVPRIYSDIDPTYNPDSRIKNDEKSTKNRERQRAARAKSRARRARLV